MDAKITKKRLNTTLSYDWIKMVFLALAIILIWMFVFSATETKIMASQKFCVINYRSNLKLNDSFYNAYQSDFERGVFSYEVIEKGQTDIATQPDYTNTLLEARIAAAEADVIFLPNIGDNLTASTVS